MAELQNFRSAFNGFNREDVVRYLEYINNKHAAQISQLKAERDSLREELMQLRAAAPADSALASELEACKANCAALEQALAASKSEQSERSAEEELQAYRRAERTERLAQERAAQIRTNATAVLADATAKVDEASDSFNAVADHVAAQLAQLQEAVLDSKTALRDAVASLYAIVPQEEAQAGDGTD